MASQVERRLQAVVGQHDDPAGDGVAGVVAAEEVLDESVIVEVRHRFRAGIEAEEIDVDDGKKTLAGYFFEAAFEVRAGQAVLGAILVR